MDISVGVLAIGSLYWDDENGREEWRQARLDIAARRDVRVPIRYGRRSSTCGDSFTMVFWTPPASEQPELGTGIFMPCRQPVRSVADLMTEAEALWAVESKSQGSDAAISAAWGCVAVVSNPHQSVSEALLAGWGDRVKEDANYQQHSTCAHPIVTGDGRLNIPWPATIDSEPLDAGLLLATATRPTLTDGSFPAAKTIAAAWQTPAGNKYSSYFWNNRQHRIATFQDAKIESILNSAA